ncbi:hypothetical protein PENSPDRAFT_663740 [Peniophora sp. CONT]|nr:hypothetical protein PENSPDRAFT_663740 [Peniophora sp. CONT]
MSSTSPRSSDLGAAEKAMMKNKLPVHIDERDEIDPLEGVKSDELHINYKSMGWVKAGALLMAETIALGILSFPLVFHRLGMFGGVFTTVMLALLSWYTGYVLVRFKANHPGVINFADAGHVVFGNFGFWLFGGMLMVTFLAGSHALSGSIALNTISSHAICNIAWAAIIAIVSFLLAIPRTFEKVSYISFVSVTCILTACMITIIATGVQHQEDLPDFPASGPVEWKAFENLGLISTVNAITNIIFAYGGHVAIFSFAAEMRNPADFTYSLGLVQIVATICYVVVGATIYRFGGQYVTSPALTMTSKPVRITAYAIALVSIIISGVVASYVGAKFIYTTMFRGTDRLTSNSKRNWAIWVLICVSIWTAGWLIAELIPFFSDLLSIISSILTVWFTYGLSGVLWLHDHSSRGPEGAAHGGVGFFGSGRARGEMLLSIFVILFSMVIMVLGMYSAIKGIADNYAAGEYSHPFNC